MSEEEDALIRARLSRVNRQDSSMMRRAQEMVRWFIDAKPETMALTEGTAPMTPLAVTEVRLDPRVAEQVRRLTNIDQQAVVRELSRLAPSQQQGALNNILASLQERAFMQQKVWEKAFAQQAPMILPEVAEPQSGVVAQLAKYGQWIKMDGLYGGEDVNSGREEIEAREALSGRAARLSFTPPTLDDAAEAAQTIITRQRRLRDEEWCERYPEQAAEERAKEQARLNIAGALSKAVEVGLLTEDRAVLLIVAGGLNDRDMTAAGALEQREAAGMIATMIQQGIRGGLFSQGDAERAMQALGFTKQPSPDTLTVDVLRKAMDALGAPFTIKDETGKTFQAVAPQLAGKNGPDIDPDPIYDEEELAELVVLALNNWPSEGEVVDEKAVGRLVKAIPRLAASIGRLTDALYDAVTVEPCHSPPHGQLHQGQGLCENQYAGIGTRVVKAIGLLPRFLPRRKHITDEKTAICCTKDGNTGTWVRFGQTLNPGLTPSRPVEGVFGTVGGAVKFESGKNDPGGGYELVIVDEAPVVSQARKFYTRSDGRVYEIMDSGEEVRYEPENAGDDPFDPDYNEVGVLTRENDEDPFGDDLDELPF